MTFATGSFGQLRFIQETVRGVTPNTGNGTNLRMTKPTMKASIATVKSQEIRPDRLSSGNTRVDQNVDGGFEFELSAKEYDPFLSGVVGSDLAHYGVLGLGTTFALSTAALLLTAGTAPTGNSAFSVIPNGGWFKLVPPAGQSAAILAYFRDTWFKADSTTGTTIVLNASTPVVAPGLGLTAVAGYAVARSAMQNGTTRKTFSFEHDLTDATSKLLYAGMEPNTLELKLEVGQILTGSFGFIGQSHVVRDGASWLPGSPVASQAYDVMNAVTDVGTVVENGVNLLASGSFIKSMTLNVNNNARGQKAVGVFGNAGVGLGEMEISGTMQVYFENSNYYAKWLNGVQTSLAVGFADQFGNGYLIEFDKVAFRDGGLNPGGNSDDVMLDLPFDAFYNATTGRSIRITRALAA